jgi:hypothetical protein
VRFPALGAALAAASLHAGCSADARPPVAPPGRVSASAALLVDDAGQERLDEAPSAEALALLSPSVAPGMREVEKGESPLPASIALPPRERDVCVRAVFAAGAPIVAALVNDAGLVLDVSEAGKQPLLEARGPVCLRKDQSAHLEVQGPPGLVRYVVWMSP